METKKFTEILKKRIKDFGMTQRTLAERVNLTPPQVNNIVKGRERLGAKHTPRWSDVLQCDPLWLMTQGEQGTPPDEAAKPVPNTQQGDVINVPVLNLDSRGGFGINNNVDVMEYAVGTMPFNRNIAQVGDVVIPVYSDSMSPKYPAGSHILIRPLEMWREYIEFGKSYVLELADWRRIIKIVKRGSDAAHLLLESYNVDYESAEVAKSFVNHMWLVVASVNREVI